MAANAAGVAALRMPAAAVVDVDAGAEALPVLSHGPLTP
eukprot:CAMPEP_0202386902 /NCGR_PEP_ID=MMETSP1127-20130417/69184_1 /ASSEMBLY_ACC=CAM_ASM_000462 /TAXON_ID=3047 /ORGANISM="Dunaliella tertiolecta, Strain CCMP1320" /LENGTH=38 /DNA_ID= /DNA_START= /DNA_END= /DNA_ORIENTATION=